MITAIGTNVLLDILVPDETFCDASIRALEAAATAGSLVICDLVYASYSSISAHSASATLFCMAMRSEWNR